MNTFPDITPEEAEKVKKLQSDLDIFRKKLEENNYVTKRENFFSLMREFWDFLFSVEDARLCEILLHSEYFQQNHTFFQEKENYAVRSMETMQALSIMNERIPSDAKTFYDFLREHNEKSILDTYIQTNKEMEMLSFSETKTLIMVGCGPFPETILYIYENTNITKIIGIDNNEEAVFMSGEMIHSQGLSDRIEIVHCDGTEYNYEKADIVFVANFVSPKSKVLKRIAETGKKNVQIMVRSPILLGKMLYENIADNIPNRLAVIKAERVIPEVLETSMVLKKLDI